MNERESSARAVLLFLVAVPVCLIFVTAVVYDISYAVTGQYSFTFSREYLGWQTGDGAVITWIPTYVLGLLLELFPFVILVRAYLLRSSTKNLQPLKDPVIHRIADGAAETAKIDPPTLYTFTDHRALCDVFGTNKNPLVKLSCPFIDVFKEKPEQLKALLLHEYSHILNKDLGLLTLRSTFIHTLGLYLVVNFTYQCISMYQYAATYAAEIPPSEMGTTVLLRILGDQFMFFLGLVLLFLLVISIYREREFLADVKTVSMVKDSTLISALKELKKTIPKGIHIEILSDHPPLQKRIDALKRTGSPSSIAVVLWTAVTVAFCILLVTHSSGEIAAVFFDNKYALERFSTSTGMWMQVAIDILFPVAVMLYLFRVERVRSFLHSVGKASLCCGTYVALIIGYEYLLRALKLQGVYLPQVTNMQNIFNWAALPGVNWIRDYVWRFFYQLNLELPSTLKYAVREWVLVFLVVFSIYIAVNICISVVRGLSVQKITASSKRTRFLIVVAVEILLIVGGIAAQIPQKEKRSTLEEWIMSYYSAFDYREPGTTAFIKAGSFDFDTQYDIEDNFYGIHILNRINGLGNLTLAQQDELIRWLSYHQDKGDFFMDFYFFKLGYKASIWEERCILRSLEYLDALDAVELEGAIRYALSECEDDPWVVFETIQTLTMLDAVETADEHLQLLAEKYFLSLDYERQSDLPEMCYEGFYSCWDTGWECILCTYWGVLTLKTLDTLDKCDKEAITTWIVAHYTEDGGFCEGLLIDWWTDPPELYQTPSDLESTFYAVKSLQILTYLDTIDREKTVQYVLSHQTRKGGFARTPQGTPTFEDTYYAVEILDALDALHQLEGSYRSSDVLLEIFHNLPLAFYILVGALVVIDFWLYSRVWT